MHSQQQEGFQILMLGASDGNNSSVKRKYDSGPKNECLQKKTGTNKENFQRFLGKSLGYEIQEDMNLNTSYGPFDVLLPSKRFLFERLIELFRLSSDACLFYYSGQAWENGDLKIFTQGQPQGNSLAFKEVKQLWLNFRPRKSAKLLIFLDSCSYSGWAQALTKSNETQIFIYNSSGSSQIKKTHHPERLLSFCLFIAHDIDTAFETMKRYTAPLLDRYSSGRQMRSNGVEQLDQLLKNYLKMSIKTFENGDKYIGELLNGKMHGMGTYYSRNGHQYEGLFKSDQIEGKGRLYQEDGEKLILRYEGEFRNWKKNGNGVEYFPDGVVYVGEFKNNQIHGKGAHYTSNGKKIEGEFRQGLIFTAMEQEDQ